MVLFLPAFAYGLPSNLRVLCRKALCFHCLYLAFNRYSAKAKHMDSLKGWGYHTEITGNPRMSLGPLGNMVEEEAIQKELEEMG